MKIYIIEPSIEVRGIYTYDVYEGFTIAANSVEEVIQLAIATENSALEDAAWKAGEVIEVGVYTGDSTIPTVLLSAYRAG